MATAIIVDKQEVQIGLAQFGAAATDRQSLLRICGEIMRTSVARTFRKQGSPAGSWPKLALSTLKKKIYTTGHKLLILSGRLFGSITYAYDDDTLTIGTNLVYAPVHQFGSKDWMGGAAGPRSLEQMAEVGEHDASYTHAVRYKMRSGVNARGKEYSVPVPLRRGDAKRMKGQSSYLQGPKLLSHHTVSAHTRRQNIPARPFLVFRPEDPHSMTDGIEAFLRGKAMRVGKVGAA